MKAKTLIKKLEKLVEKHGDKDVLLDIADDPKWYWMVDTVSFNENKNIIEIYGD